MKLLGFAVAVVAALSACGKKNESSPASGGSGSAKAPPSAPTGDNVSAAVGFATHLLQGDYAGAMTFYAPEVATKVKPEELAEISKIIGAPAGTPVITGAADPSDPEWIHVDAKYDGGGLVSDLYHVKGGKLYGMMVKPAYAPPAYVDTKTFTERPIVVGTGKQALGGILCVPNGAGPFPVVLLVQGSGGGDLDEWQPGMHEMMFRDLGEGLASRGVATLRFDKVSFAIHWLARGLKTETATIQDEYINAVHDELELAAHTDGIDPKRIFVLGHSEGGWLVPWFLRDNPAVAGGIIASGNARHFAEVMIDQDQYLLPINNPAAATPENLAILKKMDEEKAKRALDPNLAADTPGSQLPLGVPVPFWKSVATYNAPAEIAKLDKPILLVQGGRDYNVTVALDHEVWKKALAGKKDVTAKQYADLNHGYVTGTGMAKPTEATAPGHVAQPVVDDIAAWIKAH